MVNCVLLQLEMHVDKGLSPLLATPEDVISPIKAAYLTFNHVE